MKNSTRKNSLQKYTAVAGAFIAGAGVANSQVVYVDVDPDVNVSMGNSPYSLDMNGDAVNDFEFMVTNISGSGTYAYGLVNFTYSGTAAGATGVNGSVVGYYSSQQQMNVASNLSYGVGIDIQSFNADGVLAGNMDVIFTGLYSGSYTNVQLGNFPGTTDAFLGVKFDVGGNNHYGWIRLGVTAGADMITIKDYAYNAQPDGAINAGQIVGLEEVSFANKVHFKTTIDNTIVNVTPDLIGADINVVDLTGNKVNSMVISDVNTSIEHSDLNAGIYIVSVTSEGETLSKKIYIK